MSWESREVLSVKSSASTAGGDKLSQLLVLHRDRISRIVASSAGAELRRCDELEDLTQEVVKEALTFPGDFEYRGEAWFFRWILTVADRVVCARAGAAERILPPWGSENGARVRGKPQRTPSSVASEHERAEELRAVIAGLPE